MRLLLFMPLLFSLLAGCAPDSSTEIPAAAIAPDTSEQPLTQAQRLAISRNNDFGLSLLAETAAAHPAENIALSPLSLSMAFGMALNGAAGHSYTEMRDVLGFAEMERAEINEAYLHIFETLRGRDPAVIFNIANSLWYRNDPPFEVNPDFISDNTQYLHAEVHAAPFNDPATLDAMNDWVKEHTEGLIEKIFEGPIEAEDMLFLINAIYFKAEWTHKFAADLTRDATFFREDGSEVNVPTMSQRRHFNYAQNGGSEIVELPYGEGAYAMSLLLPPEGKTVAEWLASINPETIARLHGELELRDLQLTVPKYEIDFNADTIKQVLQSLGISDAFVPRTADFSRINTDHEDLHISDVAHKAFIRVDEDGTEAGAATGITIGVTSMPQMLSFNRPFIFLIRDRDSGALLFNGVVRDPSST